MTQSLAALVDDAPEPERRGRVARWVTEQFNEWPEGTREAALEAQRAGRTVAQASTMPAVSGAVPEPDGPLGAPASEPSPGAAVGG